MSTTDDHAAAYEAAYTRLRDALYRLPIKAPEPSPIRSHGGRYRLQSGYPSGYPMMAVIFLGAAALFAIAWIRSWWKGDS